MRNQSLIIRFFIYLNLTKDEKETFLGPLRCCFLGRVLWQPCTLRKYQNGLRP